MEEKQVSTEMFLTGMEITWRPLAFGRNLAADLRNAYGMYGFNKGYRT